MNTQINDTQITTIQRALNQFGYTELSAAEVRAEVDALLAGDPPDNVIGMFVRGWLRDAGLLPDVSSAGGLA